jgi:hypothetical protein
MKTYELMIVLSNNDVECTEIDASSKTMALHSLESALERRLMEKKFYTTVPHGIVINPNHVVKFCFSKEK